MEGQNHWSNKVEQLGDMGNIWPDLREQTADVKEQLSYCWEAAGLVWEGHLD